jgi:hypothetical protein
MLNKSAKGIIQAGKVQLVEQLDAADGTEVQVIVVEQQAQSQSQSLSFGMFAKPGAIETSWQDFQDVKKIWEPRTRE